MVPCQRDDMIKTNWLQNASRSRLAQAGRVPQKSRPQEQQQEEKRGPWQRIVNRDLVKKARRVK